jgi:hypothetical protein
VEQADFWMITMSRNLTFRVDPALAAQRDAQDFLRAFAKRRGLPAILDFPRLDDDPYFDALRREWRDCTSFRAPKMRWRKTEPRSRPMVARLQPLGGVPKMVRSTRRNDPPRIASAKVG